MAYVRIYYHREPKRIAPHVRYIARRPESDGLRGLGSAFRELRGDVDASVRLLEQHATQARVHAGATTREGPFVRLLFTLPTDLAARVAQADARLTDGARLVLRDAVEATFRSVGRQLQGVYAIHFHAAQRGVHGHAHVDLSPLDTLGRPTFVTEEQRTRFRSVWEREVVKAVERAEKRAPGTPEPAQAHAHEAAGREEPRASRASANPQRAATATGTTGTRAIDAATRTAATEPGTGAHSTHEDARRGTTDAASWETRRPFARRRQRLHYVPVLTEWLLGRSRTPLVDLFVRALIARTERRLARPRPALAVRFALGLPVPRVIVRPTTPLVRPTLLRLPYWS